MSDASSLFRRRRPRPEGDGPSLPPIEQNFPNPYRDDFARPGVDPRAAKPIVPTQAPARRATDLAPQPAPQAQSFGAPLPTPITPAAAARSDEARLAGIRRL